MTCPTQMKQVKLKPLINKFLLNYNTEKDKKQIEEKVNEKR